MIVGAEQTGKSNLLAQFACYHEDQAVSYFISANPLEQRQYAFLYSMCYQLAEIIGDTPPPRNISEDLKGLFTALSIGLARLARQSNTLFFFVVDGLEWALDGPKGNRIIDLFPPRTAPHSPYLLFSCRTDQIKLLPDRIPICEKSEPRLFHLHDTRDYLSDLGLSSNEIALIQEKYQGNPGHLSVIREIKLADPSIKLDSIQSELDRLISRQVSIVLSSAEDHIRAALEFLAASPTPLQAAVLAELVGANEVELVEQLKSTGLVRFQTSGSLDVNIAIYCGNDYNHRSSESSL